MPITVSDTNLDGVLLIKPSVFEDHRGIYVETYNTEDYHKNNIKINFVRDDISTSSKNVLRGLHYDAITWKLIQCMYGKIYFVVADMRRNSKQYLKWESFLLTGDNRLQILVPPGFANGHLVLSGSCIFHYKMSEHYHPENEVNIKWNDPELNIFWPIREPILSFKDSSAEYLRI